MLKVLLEDTGLWLAVAGLQQGQWQAGIGVYSKSGPTQHTGVLSAELLTAGSMSLQAYIQATCLVCHQAQ